MDQTINLKNILELHLKWIMGEDGGARADLSGADLIGADLIGADLIGADLSGANLSGADLRRADLSGANLSGADLSGANLNRANLSGADLRRADLSNCTGAELALAMATHLPEGRFDAWKKCKNGVLVHLRIPAKAKRSHGCERKCRAEYVKVLGVYNPDGTHCEVGISQHDNKTEYRKGQTVYPDGWDEDRWNTCGQGIHFFLTKLEAQNY